MRQAIETRFLSPTNFRPARVVARAEAGRVVINWDHALNIENNHRRAMQTLADKFDWPGRWIGGGVANGYVFVLDDTFPSA